MTALTYTVTDSRVMLRRNLRRLVKYPSLTIMLVGLPVVFLLLFVFVFGGQLGAGMTTSTGATGRAAYLDYVVPGIILVTIASAVQGSAIVVAMDMTSGIINRFRTMDIGRSSVLVGHVLASLIQALFSIAIVLAVAIALGFRPTVDPLGWLGALVSRSCSRSPDLAGDLPGPRRGHRGDRQQLADVPDDHAVSQHRFRSRRVPARRGGQAIRRVPAVHPGHRGPPWSSHRRNGSHRQRDRGNCLEPGHRRGILRTRPAHL